MYVTYLFRIYTFFIVHVFPGKGFYIYIEASGRKAGDKADLLTPVLPPTATTGYCFSFWYHMYGPSIGTLNIYTQQNSLNKLRWTKSGTQGNAWKQGYLNIVSSTDFKIMLEGITTRGYQGDIAIDDIFFENVPCGNSTVVQFSKVCDFESNLCAYTQDTTDDFDWTWSGNATSSMGTGPTTDHTTGSGAGTQY